MSKKKKKKKRRTGGDTRQKVLKNMLACESACGDLGEFEEKKFDSMYDRVDFCAEKLPSFSFVESQFINYIFSDGMVAGGVSENAILDSFRFRLNEQNTTNNSVLRDAIRLAHCRYGECGVRWKDGNVYLYKSGTYAPLTYMDDGIETVVAYLATKDGTYINGRDVDIESLTPIDGEMRLSVLANYFDKHGLILLDKSEFVSIRNDTSLLHGEAPLEKDKLRIDLLVSVYERLNYDVNYDGPGRLLFPVKSGYIDNEDNEVSTSRIVKQMGNNKERRAEVFDEIERITEDIKDSSSDSAIAISDGFKEPIHLPRVTKATEFLEWLQAKEGEIMADIMGLPPSLLEEGELSGNVSMTRIVDNAMLNSIIPLREHYASQISQLIAGHLGLQKVYFDKYTLQSEESDTQKWLKVATTMQQLNTIEDMPEVKEVIRGFAEMLDYDTHDSVGDVIELKRGTEKEKKSWLTRLLNN